MKTHYSLNSFIPGLNIRLQILCFSDRFLRVTRISYPHLRCILSAENPDNSHSPKAKKTSAIPQKAEGKFNGKGSGPRSVFCNSALCFRISVQNPAGYPPIKLRFCFLSEIRNCLEYWWLNARGKYPDTAGWICLWKMREGCFW